MKFSLVAVLCALVFCGATIAGTQQPVRRPSVPKPVPAAEPTAEADHEISLGKLTPTPEMWFYDQQLRQYKDPKMAVRRRASFEADQRQMRLAAQRWFGYSNSRPTVNPSPFTGVYSPMWTSNSNYPNMWRGTNPATVYVPTESGRPNAGYGLW